MLARTGSVERAVSRLLVVGGDSQLGREIVASAGRLGLDAVATSRRQNQDLGRQSHYLDLTDEATFVGVENGVTHAILAAGVTSLQDCERDPRQSRVVNVVGPAGLLGRLARAGVPTTVISTSQVFSRDQDRPGPSDERSPTCEYGRQKAELEDIASDLGMRIARCTKILAAHQGLIHDWDRDLRRGHTIAAFSNMMVAPITARFTAEALLSIALQDGVEGVVHLSSRDECSYFQAARWVALAAGADADLVLSVDARSDPSSGIIIGPHAALGQPWPEPGRSAPTAHNSILSALGAPR